ncbi:ead/Ea22-like family protein [Pseudomonas aeruginosa]|uniref:ead/Ea22-like family protein n=1 Tax=Pseudomonas aeruginosa TaxID=287 RepID=UPI00192CE27D|nr:ead/Ea22-like family protein [Pseudomonas aeruginosa]EKW1691499.1 ead/Ea22-like family protein [Pseudomonas aeruginosa]MBP5960469.1 ead/Ea22-like family protein [Pseudomonas aeruginosa]MDE5271677.1 ead/Ea22-like family protein [Pseudomonas aeruginosa]MDE5284264.1 ead/Ea22-like family protein [Pseudomonas aeruginosa]
MTDHAELRRLAEVATPGEWRTGDGDDSLPDCVLSGEFVVCEHAGGDVDYIAAANPKTVLALLDEIDGLKAENETLREALFQISSASCSDARSVVIARTALTKGATK